MKTKSQSQDVADLISARAREGRFTSMPDAVERLTTAQGVVIADNQNSLARGCARADAA